MAYRLIESPDPPLCQSSMVGSQFCLQGLLIGHVFPMITIDLLRQMVIDQNNRDKNVSSLLSKMGGVYTFLTQQELRDIEYMKTLVTAICQQTLDCSYFIQRYAQDMKFRELAYLGKAIH